ncbi:hypothetical protein KIN20_006234 [Parelaphostrongylus tenuis]|uniref:Uncharacterized protein n=1 Tax=Parelaphostrongylus tenuis TaxID=148309 RepID=A0AAD5QFT4_PARTN|nr:hypothetical protein KIN20_006234 [Parelaphostrongylus tenuis]
MKGSEINAFPLMIYKDLQANRNQCRTYRDNLTNEEYPTEAKQKLRFENYTSMICSSEFKLGKKIWKENGKREYETDRNIK